jgi:hypothetical protein
VFNYEEAVRRLHHGAVVGRNGCQLMFVRKHVAVAVYLDGAEPQLYDLARGAFWQLNSEDLAATDWTELQLNSTTG